MIMMGALPPNPRDLPLFLTRMDVFSLYRKQGLPYNRNA